MSMVNGEIREGNNPQNFQPKEYEENPLEYEKSIEITIINF